MFTLRNYMEDVVIGLAGSVLKNMGCCTCEKCKRDAAAIALNSLPPKYVVTKKGEIYTKIISLHHQFEVDVISALSYAAEKVRNYPRHDVN